MKGVKVLGIDPGLQGAFVLTDGQALEIFPMPIVTSGKDKIILFAGVFDLLSRIQKKHGQVHVYLERAIPFALGAKSAFSYGRGFETLVVAVELLKFPMTYVEPAKWTKEMHEGISADLRPKVKSGIAVKRLYPQLVASMPRKKNGTLDEGPMDALLIAGYGLRRVGGKPVKAPEADVIGDFF